MSSRFRRSKLPGWYPRVPGTRLVVEPAFLRHVVLVIGSKLLAILEAELRQRRARARSWESINYCAHTLGLGLAGVS